MATAAQPQSRPQANGVRDQPSNQGTPVTPIVDGMLSRFEEVRRGLAASAKQLAGMLPDALKSQAERFVKCAEVTFSRTPQLQDCPPREFIRCVLAAASVGLVIDGKLAYVVQYKGTWQFQADYKGLVAVARLWGVIKDCYADVIYSGDDFDASRDGPASHLHHKRNLGKSRGDIVGAYAVVILPDGGWRYELMDRDELDQIQRLAPSKKGPWGSEYSTVSDEMRKKTVIRRILKLYQTDPAVAAALESMDDPETFGDEHGNGVGSLLPPAGRQPIRGNQFASPPSSDVVPVDDGKARDVAADLASQINLAESVQHMHAIGALANEQRALLGEVIYAQFERHYQARYREIIQGQPEREPGSEG